MMLMHKTADYIQFKAEFRGKSGAYRVPIVFVAAGSRADWRRRRNSGKEARAGFSIKDGLRGSAQLGMG